jgi:hypothetical protein
VKRCKKCLKVTEGGHERDGTDLCWCPEPEDEPIEQRFVMDTTRGMPDFTKVRFPDAACPTSPWGGRHIILANLSKPLPAEFECPLCHKVVPRTPASG